MASPFSAKSTKHYNVRCISLPARSHPVAMKIEEELNKLKSWEISSPPSNGKKISSSLTGLGEIYKCIGELFGLPLTQETLAQHQRKNWVNELVDGLIIYLDICGSTRDVVLMIKQSVRELQPALRRSKGGDLSNIDSNVNAYIGSRKKMKKEIANCLATLEQIDSSSPISELNDYLNLVIKLLRKASLITNSILNSLLQFLCVSTLKPKCTKWSLVLKLVHKRVATFEGQCEENEFENVDIALSKIMMVQQSCNFENTESAQEKLEALDGGIEGFENALECLYRQLIQARVFLLNILSLSGELC